jgi:hypothetical protein
MTKKIFKRTYRVAFHPNVAKMIEGAKKGKTFIGGYHDLIYRSHEDNKFQDLDVAFTEIHKEAKKYKKNFNKIYNREVRYLVKKQGWTMYDVRKMEKRDKEHYQLKHQTRKEIEREVWAQYEKGIITENPIGVLFEIFQGPEWRKKDDYEIEQREFKKKLKKEGKLTHWQIKEAAHEKAYNELGHSPDDFNASDVEANAPIWKPIFDRGYWEFVHISEDVPDWISEREYSIAHEELYEPEVKILKTKTGKRVNWASRNRGSKVVVSSKKFRKDTKIYPENLNPDGSKN